ncbi:MAG: DNA polymerase III subunit delta' [Flavobacteriaceae bacterium]|nr:DNA polymerase III subunit delta' [Flavobacteriaceae bacterium]MDG2314726.1 DNA polymerase III subunit delta' [Flavobacteriaceae bacterium]
MLFQDVIGHEGVKKDLLYSVAQQRVAHAQLFVGPEGSGTLPLAIAYAQYVLCENQGNENTGGNAACNLKMEQISHPDMHFVFPVANNNKVKSKATSSDFMDEWRQFLKQQPFGNLFDWYQLLGIENKQGQIGVDEAQSIVKKLSLKSYEGGWKVVIVWCAEKLNIAASNKLLKLIEEPPEKTLLLLVVENEELLLETLRSRCQKVLLPSLSAPIIESGLLSLGCEANEAKKIAFQAQGNFNKAVDLLNNDSEDLHFEKWFVSWVRAAFKARGNKSAILELVAWSQQVAGSGRETQKKFLDYCVVFFRQALLVNYDVSELVYLEPKTKFELWKFAPFIHGNNILDIVKELEEANYHIERNGNAKMIFTDLSIKLTRLLHRPS